MRNKPKDFKTRPKSKGDKNKKNANCLISCN